MNKAKIYAKLEKEIEYYVTHTQRQYRAFVGDYLTFVGNENWKDEDVLYRYVKKLKTRKYAQSHILWILRGPISTLFRAHGIEKLPVKIPKFLGISTDISDRIAFAHDEVEALIKAARNSEYLQWQTYMALSTIWGLRAAEIRQFRHQDITHDGKAIKIYTLKGGRTTEHQIPPGVEFITDYEFPILSENAIFAVFDGIRQAAKLPYVSRKSWHAIRHTVMGETHRNRGSLSDCMVNNWFRCKLKSYCQPQSFDDDKKIYPIHPFLKCWQE